MYKILRKMLLILLIGIQFAYAQDMRFRNIPGNLNLKGKITGILLDQQSQTPIEYGNIVVYRYRDSSMVTGTTSNAQGKFILDDVNIGRYFIKISFIGFNERIIDSVFVTPKNTEIDLGKIYLEPSVIKLGEVQVTGEKEMIINNLDKRVINVEKDISSTGGSALDVMQNLPSVTVDADGNIALRGNTNIRLLIDGKPTNLEGVSNYDILSQIPASQISQIELVTNPSVRYDPEGAAGIINIILKKKKDAGINGIITLNVGTNDKYNTSLNGNHKLDGLNVYAGYDGRINKFSSSGTSYRISSIENTNLDQTQSGTNKFNSNNFTLGFDYYLDEYNQFNSSLKYRKNTFDNSSNNIDRKLYYNNEPISLTERINTGDRSFNNLNFTFGYNKKYPEKGREFTLDFFYSNFNMDRLEDANQINVNYSPLDTTLSLRRIWGSGKSNLYNFQANYAHPFRNGMRLEFGIDTKIRDMKTKSDYYNFDYLNSAFSENADFKNYFNYNEQIYAVYGIFSHSIFGIKYQLGLRGERVLAKSTLPLMGRSFNKDYNSLYPSVHLAYEYLPMNEISLSFSRRVDRPNNRQLNPVVDYSDSLNVFAGNPYLNPQYTNSVELGFNNALGFIFLNTTFFYRNTNDVISSVSSLQNGVLYTTFKNVAKSRNYGLELVWTQPVTKWWRFMTNFSYFKTEVDGGELGFTQNATSWMIRIMSSLTFWNKTQLQLIFNYNSPSITMSGGMFGGGGRYKGSSIIAQGKMYEMYGLDLAVRKDFLNDKLSLTLRLSDVFNTRKFGGEVNGEGFISKFNRKMDTRVLYLGISYKFNNYQNKQERLPEEVDQEMF